MSSNAAAVRPSSVSVRVGDSRRPRCPRAIERARLVIASSGASATRTVNTSTSAVTTNALIPVTTVIALDFAAIIGGAIITEIAFGWVGMGRFLLDGLTGPVSPDTNVVQAWLLVAATAVILFNIIADLLYAVLDPRIRYA